jgi:hypothetical protein
MQDARCNEADHFASFAFCILHFALHASRLCQLIRTARNAGTAQARSATVIRPMLPATYVGRSVGVTSNNNVVIIRVAASAATTPMMIPVTASIAPRRTTIISTMGGVAPRARRSPISAVRCVTK